MRTKFCALALLGVLTVLASGQDSAASRPVPDVKLPVADQAKPFEEKDPIVVEVSRTITETAAATRPRSFDDWAIGIGTRSFAFDRAGFERLTVRLSSITGVKSPQISQRALLIRADSEAPYGMVQKVLEAAARARIYRIWLETAPGSKGERNAMVSWLPVERAPESMPADSFELLDEIRVLLSWNSDVNRLERLIGQRIVPTTPDGDRLLETTIKAERERYQKEQKPDVPLIIDVGPMVHWRYVVDVMNLAQRLGIKRVEFAFGVQMK